MSHYHRSNPASEPMSSHHPNTMKPAGGTNRAPLRQRSMNTHHNAAQSKPSSGPSISKPSSSHRKSSSSRAKESNEPVEIEELRRKPNGEGHTVHRYLRGKLLGKGGFAKVYLCTSLDTNRSYAVKIVPKANLVKARARQKLQAEIKIHRSLKHKHVCEYKHFFEDKTNCYILLELCQNQSMNELLKRRKRLTEPEVKYFLSHLLESVQYMHGLNVIHRDLKLGNLFLDKHLRVKVGDFGLATKLSASDEKRKTICGTPNYIAPEVIEGDKEKRGHSFEVDIWSIGVICYTLLVGKPPYESKDVKSTYQRILRNEYSFPSHVPMSQHARDLISSMLQTRPDKRPSLETLCAHPFFTHDPTKIPRSLPSCCTHVAPDWQEDRDGYLVPILAEADEHKHRSAKPTVRRKEPLAPSRSSTQVQNPLTAEKNDYVAQSQPGRGKENEPAPQKAPGQFEIYAENALTRQSSSKSDQLRNSGSIRIRSANHEARQETDIDFAGQEPDNGFADAITQKLEACAIQDSPAQVDPSRRSYKGTSDADAQALESMYSRLKDLGDRVEANGGPLSFKPASPINMAGAKKWVTRYVDYTSKYGLGFLFNDGSAGVYFNDSTKAVLQPKGESFIYVERKKISNGDVEIIEQIPEVHCLSNHPETLQKKVTLLKHFRNYLIEQHKREESNSNNSFSDFDFDEEDASKATVFLKKWVRTKHAILFRLSNQTVQVVFYDHTEILLTSEARIVTYVNKKQERETYRLDDVMTATEHGDIKKRLKYAEGILHQLVSGQK